MQGKHKVAAVLAITVFGCECSLLAASFVTHNKNSFGVNNFQAIRESISSMGPFSLNMAEERDYISPMRQRKLSPPPFASTLLRVVLIITRRFDSVRTAP